MTAPTLHTERLTLRARRMVDFPAFRTFCASDRALYMGGPLSERDAWNLFCRGVASWTLLGLGWWAIDRTNDGVYLGDVGLNEHPFISETELGWLVLPEAEGAGIAREAAVAARAWAYATGRFETMVSYIRRDNARSIGLAERLGAAHDPAARSPYDSHDVYRHPAPGAVQ